MKSRILLIDDDPGVVLLMKARLEANGYEIITASNGGEGVNKCLVGEPDLIILDVRMPGMDGWTFLNEIRKSPKGKPIPILMATAEKKLEDLFNAEGVVGYVTKPYKAEDLLQKVRAALENEK